MMMLALLAANCQQPESNGSQEEVTGAKVTLIDVDELKEVLAMGSDIQLIDVRTPKEFNGGTIGDAININFFDPDFEKQMLKKVDPSRPVYLFCRSGRRSADAATKLKAIGFVDLYDLKGGYLNWSKEN